MKKHVFLSVVDYFWALWPLIYSREVMLGMKNQKKLNLGRSWADFEKIYLLGIYLMSHWARMKILKQKS